jgi:Flp pilus assembly protein TadD
VHSVLGAVYRDAARDQDAIRQFQKAMQLAPGNAEAPRQLAECYTNTGRFNEAEALYLQAVKSRPTDWYGFFVLGIFYYQRERYAESEQTILKAKALTPDNDMVSRNLGSIYRMHGRYREAVEELQYTRGSHQSPDHAALAGAYFFEHRFAGGWPAETATRFHRFRLGQSGRVLQWAPEMRRGPGRAPPERLSWA